MASEKLTTGELDRIAREMVKALDLADAVRNILVIANARAHGSFAVEVRAADLAVGALLDLAHAARTRA